jgi:enterochelin esterase-like enzyme
VFYLIHGGGDEDSAWSTVGRAGFILDNLLAAGKIKPMIVVMPNGSITLPGVPSPMGGGRATTPEAMAARIALISKLHDAFVSDLLTGIIPYTEQTYRALATRENRAIAGLSMGGAETLRAAPSNLDKFAWIGVFSMGLQEGSNAGVNSDFVQRNAAFFADAEKTNKQLKLFWIAAGNDDRTVTDGPRRLSETLKAHNIRHEYHETVGGHTWINWRLYLRDFSQLLFR